LVRFGLCRLASVAIVLVWENFVLDPLLTFFFGDREWYRMRGYYYNYDLGEAYRKV
jgi:uncharacterized membrane protein